MSVESRYLEAKEMYRSIGVDTDKALEELKKIKVSMHCWQGDDVVGFDSKGPLTGGIQTTGNYPGKARTPEELMADIDEALKLIPGKHKINLHASYAIFDEGEWVDADGSSSRRSAALAWTSIPPVSLILSARTPRSAARRKKCGSSGSTIASPASGSASISQKNWDSPA